MDFQINESPGFKAGIVALLGRPNVGKSSLVNRILGVRVNIVSNKPQTTRDNILAVYNGPDFQIVFRDMPGVHIPRHELGQHLVRTARRGLEEIDLVCYMVEAGKRKLNDDDLLSREILEDAGAPFILVVNKIDISKVPEIQEIESAKELYCQNLNPIGTLAVSAKTGRNVDLLLDMIRTVIPEGYPYYPDDIIVDSSERFLASEFIREKIFQLTGMEIPHCTAVKVDEYKSPDEYPERKDLYIRATIFVERDSQKKIIIGKGGSMIKRIGSLARTEIEKFTGHKVYLDLWIKVRKNWRRSPVEVRRMGYR